MPSEKYKMDRKNAIMQINGEYKNFIKKFFVCMKEMDFAIRPAF